MRYHAYLENNSGAWVDFSDKITSGAGAIELKIGSDGQPVISPPSTLAVDNSDGYWLTEPAVVSSAFYGAWEDRRVKLTAEIAGGAEIVLAICRVATENGFEANRDGSGALHLEGLAEVLSRADASDVSLGRGAFPNIPWTLAVDRLRKPEDSSAMALPNDLIPYENGIRACSSIGMPGDYRSGTFYELRGTDRSVDQCYNETAGVFAFLTYGGQIYEYNPATGQTTQAAVIATMTGYHALRIFWKRQSTGNGIYLIVGQSESGVSGYHSPRELMQKGGMLRVWRHDQASPLYTSGTAKFMMAPVLVRDLVRTRESAWTYANGNRPGCDRALPYGNEFYDYEDTTPGYASIEKRRENLLIPFDQFAYPLESRNATVNSGFDSIERIPMKLRGGWPYSWVSAFGPMDDRSWEIDALAGVPAAQRFLDCETRGGRNYETCVIRDNDGGFTWFNPADYRSSRTGFRHSVGQGPLFDLSFEHSGNASWDGRFWFACAAWDPTLGWQVICILVTGSGSYEATVTTLGFNKLPTFVVCDITRPSDSNGQKGAVIVGWIDYESNTTQKVGNDADLTTGSCWMARSGLNVYPVASASSSAAPTFSPAGGTVVKFAEKNEGDSITRQYWPAAGTGHSSGRWTPLAMGFRRYNSEPVAGQYYTHYNCVLSCIDRMEVCPSKTGSSENAGAGDNRSGSWTYRLLYLHITILGTSGSDALPYATGLTDTYGPGYDIQWGSPLPPMGLSRICQGENGDEGSRNTAETLWFFNPSDRSLYEMRPNDTDKCRPVLRGTIDHFDNFLGMGTLAVGNHAGDKLDPIVAAVTHPVFPCSSSEQWADGQYYAFIYGPYHSGRIPLLETTNDSKLKALTLAAAIRPAIYFLDRDGAGRLRLYPTGTSPSLRLTPSDYADGSRSLMPILNNDQRSVSDVVPGKVTVTALATPKSRFAAVPTVSGFGVYPANIDLKCIASGLVTDGMNSELIPESVRGKVLWAWKLTGKRLQTTLVSAVASGATAFAIEDGTTVAAGDRLTLGVDDDSLPIDSVYWSSGTAIVVLGTALSKAYESGATVYIDPAGDGYYSDQIRWDDEKEIYRGIAAVAAAAGTGTRSLRVTTIEPFAPGTFFRIHSKTGLDTEDYKATYIVERVRQARETGATYHEIEFRQIEGTGGLLHAVNLGDPIGVFLNVPPIGHSVRIGQTGIQFGLIAEQGSVDDQTEPAISEGDMVRISFEGLVTSKNENRRVSATDADSIGVYGEKKRKRKVANKYMDYQLALADVCRQVRRYGSPKISLELRGVKASDPANQETLLRLLPWDVVRVTDFELFPDRGGSGYAVDFTVEAHRLDPQTGLVDLSLEELDASAPSAARYIEEAVPSRIDFTASGDDAAVILSWTPPQDTDFDGVMIRWSTTGYPANTSDGTLLGEYDAVTFAATHSSLTNGTVYYYTLFTKNTLGFYSKGAIAAAQPAADVGNATGLAAASEDGSLVLTWTDAAGDDVIGFVVRYRSDGTYPTGIDNGTGAGKALPGDQTFTITGLSNGVEYKVAVFTVDATGNASGGAQVTATPDFDPADYGTVSARYRAHDLRSVGDAGLIDAWTDASGGGMGLIKHADANRPALDLVHSGYNNLPVVNFNSSITAKTLRSSVTWTGGFNAVASTTLGWMAVLVGSISTTASSDTLFSVYVTSNLVFYWRGGTVVIYQDKAGAAYSQVDVSAYISVNTPTTFAFAHYPGRFFRVYINGVMVAEDTTSIATGPDATAVAYFCLGTTQYTGNALQGDVAELVMFSEFNEPALEKTMRDLRAKYAHYADADTGGDYSNGFSGGFERTTYSPFSSGLAAGCGADRKE